MLASHDTKTIKEATFHLMVIVDDFYYGMFVIFKS